MANCAGSGQIFISWVKKTVIYSDNSKSTRSFLHQKRYLPDEARSITDQTGLMHLLWFTPQSDVFMTKHLASWIPFSQVLWFSSSLCVANMATVLKVKACGKSCNFKGQNAFQGCGSVLFHRMIIPSLVLICGHGEGVSQPHSHPFATSTRPLWHQIIVEMQSAV